MSSMLEPENTRLQDKNDAVYEEAYGSATAAFNPSSGKFNISTDRSSKVRDEDIREKAKIHSQPSVIATVQGETSGFPLRLQLLRLHDGMVNNAETQSDDLPVSSEQLMTKLHFHRHRSVDFSNTNNAFLKPHSAGPNDGRLPDISSLKDTRLQEQKDADTTTISTGVAYISEFLSSKAKSQATDSTDSADKIVEEPNTSIKGELPSTFNAGNVENIFKFGSFPVTNQTQPRSTKDTTPGMYQQVSFTNAGPSGVKDTFSAPVANMFPQSTEQPAADSSFAKPNPSTMGLEEAIRNLRNELNDRIATILYFAQEQKTMEDQLATFEWHAKVEKLEIDLLELRAEFEQAKEEAQERFEDLEETVVVLLEKAEEEE